MSKEERQDCSCGAGRAKGWCGVKSEPLGDLCNFLFFGTTSICLMPKALKEDWELRVCWSFCA